MPMELTSGFRFNAAVEADDRSVYPTVEAALVTGCVFNGVTKSRISMQRRHEGLAVWITEEQKLYRFIGGITDGHFVPAPSVTGSGAGTIIWSTT